MASSKLRILLPVLPSGDDAEKESNEHSKISKSMSAATDLSRTVEQSIDGRNKISMNDSVYGYKAIVLKKITEEGLKDLLENGSKSKVTATVTYKVMYTLRPEVVLGGIRWLIVSLILFFTYNSIFSPVQKQNGDFCCETW